MPRRRDLSRSFERRSAGPEAFGLAGRRCEAGLASEHDSTKAAGFKACLGTLTHVSEENHVIPFDRRAAAQLCGFVEAQSTRRPARSPRSKERSGARGEENPCRRRS
jgi:hypothetical protein